MKDIFLCIDENGELAWLNSKSIIGLRIFLGIVVVFGFANSVYQVLIGFPELK